MTRLSPVFGAALGLVLEQHPDMRVVVPAAGPVAGLVREQVAEWPGDPLVIDPGAADPAHKRAGFATATIALAASGTVSLELAAAGTPMVIAYDFNWLSRQIIKRMMLSDTATLVNLVSETRVVPECLGADCRPDLIAARLSEVLASPEQQAEAMTLTMQRLGRGGEAPGLRAAKAVLVGLASSAQSK